jgi:hypothetical protein
VTEQGYPPRPPGYPGRSARSRPDQEPRRTGWQAIEAFDDNAGRESDLPPWAVPGGIEPVRAPRRPQRAAGAPPVLERSPAAPAERAEEPEPGRRAGRSRAAAARRRKSRRRLVTWGGTTVVLAALVLGGWYLARPSHATKSSYITTLRKGELSQVPNACRAIGSATLRQYLNGTPAGAQAYNGKSQSQCTYTVDAKPTFRELNISVQAYPPNLTVPGNGSATAAATYTFTQQRDLLAKPPKNTPQPAATVTPLAGLGNEALSAVQVFHVGSTSERVTVVTRYRNVIVTVFLQGQTSGGFGPVPVGELRAGALAVARSVMQKVTREPTVS